MPQAAIPRCATKTIMRSRFGFTLLEMLVTLTVVAAIAAAVAPMLSDDSRVRVMAASSIIASDIELAQVMTIAHPNSPVVVRFDPAHAKYWLAYAATPDTPIARDDTGEPYVVTLGEGRARSAAGVALAVEQMASDRMTFASHGGLINFTTTPLIKVTTGSRGIQLAVSPTTGSVHESEIAPLAEPTKVEAISE